MIRVVIADDHTIVREGLRQLLEAAGDIAVVAEAVNGHEVVDRIRDSEFDILLLDLSMPGMNGRQLAERLAAQSPGLPTIFISGYSAEHIFGDRLLAEGSTLLTKPFVRTQLAVRVRFALDRTAARNAKL